MLNRRRTIAAVLASSLLGSSSAQAILFSGNGIGGGGGGSTLTTRTFVNTSGSTQAANFISPTFGVTFKKGDIAAGTAPKFQVGGVDQPFSWGLQSYYNDGSLRQASFRVKCSSLIAGSGTVTVNILSGGTAPAQMWTLSQALTHVYAQNLQINATGLGAFAGLTGNWHAYVLNDANNLEQLTYMDGQAGKSLRLKINFAQTQGGAAHGQMVLYEYIDVLPDNSGNLGSFRHMPSIQQPYYNNDTPTKNWRGLSSLTWSYGAGPTTVNWNWPYSTLNLTGSNGSPDYVVAAAGTHNYYTGSGVNGVNCVPGYFTSTTDAAVSTNQLYFAYTIFGTSGNNTQLRFSTSTQGLNGAIASLGGSATFVPVPTLIHFVPFNGAGSDAKSLFFQGTGSVAADCTVRTQFDRTYFHSTGVIPPWNLSVSGIAFGGTIKDIPTSCTTQAASWTYWGGSPVHTPVSVGPLSPQVRGGGGENPDIGPYTLWHACHFYNQTAVGEQAVRSIAFASGFDGAGNFRDVTTGNYINVSNASYTGMPAPSSDQQGVIGFTYGYTFGYTAPSNPAVSNFLWGGLQAYDHKPSMAPYAFIVFGEPYFYDAMIEEGIATFIEHESRAARVQSAPAPVGYGIIMGPDGDGLRTAAWSLRSLGIASFLAANVSPDGSQVPAYLNDMRAGNTAWANALFSATYQGSYLNGLNSWNTLGLDDFAGSTISAYCGGFMMSYQISAMALNAGLGDADALTWLNTYQGFQNYVLTNWGGYNLYAEYDHQAQQATGGSSDGLPITSGAYGVSAQGMFSYLSWGMASPAFSTPGMGFGFVPQNGTRVIFGRDQATLPGGFSYETGYFMVNANAGAGTFDLSATLGGSAILPTTASTTISGYSYNSGTGILSLTTAAAHGLSSSDKVLFSNVTGTGYAPNLATTLGLTCTAGTTGTNININIGTGQTITVTGGQVNILTPGFDPAAGFASPWILMATPPVASTGQLPNGTDGVPGSYVCLRGMAFNWAAASGATGFGTPSTGLIGDATIRRDANPPDFTWDANWYGQNSF
jgi:hypothetical protein